MGGGGAESGRTCLLSTLLLSPLPKHFSEPCEPTEATAQGQQRGHQLAEATAAGVGVVCRRASQEDMGLDDTASQQSASDEQ